MPAGTTGSGRGASAGWRAVPRRRVPARRSWQMRCKRGRDHGGASSCYSRLISITMQKFGVRREPIEIDRQYSAMDDLYRSLPPGHSGRNSFGDWGRWELSSPAAPASGAAASTSSTVPHPAPPESGAAASTSKAAGKSILRRSSSFNTQFSQMQLHSSDHKEHHRAVFLDLENLAFTASHLDPMRELCRAHAVEFRSYTTQTHAQAQHATHRVPSLEKGAVDHQISMDIGALLNNTPNATILVITDDHFGRTLASLQCQVYHAGWSSRLDRNWRDLFGAVTLEEYFAERDVHKERKSRSRSQSAERPGSGYSSRASWSRPASRSQSRDPSRSGSRPPPSRASSPLPRRRNNKSKIKPRKWPKGQSPTEGKQVGTIVRWTEKGFGFIRPHSGSQEIFVHISNILFQDQLFLWRLNRFHGHSPVIDFTNHQNQIKSLVKCDVEFNVVAAPKGMQARNVSGPKGTALPTPALAEA